MCSIKKIIHVCWCKIHARNIIIAKTITMHTLTHSTIKIPNISSPCTHVLQYYYLICNQLQRLTGIICMLLIFTCVMQYWEFLKLKDVYTLYDSNKQLISTTCTMTNWVPLLNKKMVIMHCTHPYIKSLYKCKFIM